MRRPCGIVVAGLIVLSIVSSSGATENWSLSKLVPFKKSATSKRAHASVSDDSHSRGFPKLPVPSWGSSSRSPKRSAEPSMLTKLNQGTKDAFGKTKDVLMPWSKNTKKPTTRPASSRSKTNHTPWYKAILPQREPAKKLNSVSDFIGQDRPGP